MEREQLEVDVLFVGAGPACLAGALHLSRQIAAHNQAVDSGQNPGKLLEDPLILVIEKGREIGSHGLSGAVVDPRGYEELLSDMPDQKPPYDCEVKADALYLMTKKQAIRSPVTPPPLQNHGYYVASLGKLVKWMGNLCEENGVEVYPEFPAVELLFDGDRVVGARIGDKGRDDSGNPKPNFEPGIDVLAKVTVLGEGPRGTLARQAFERLKMERDSQPQTYAIGVKEVWKMPRDVEAGTVYHTLGFPLGTAGLGGGFIYTMKENLIDIGFVTPLDCKDPHTDGHQMLQRFKTHPFVREMLEGGKPISFGAKAIPEGGYYSIPKKPYAAGLLLIGDTVAMLNAQRLKGIHMAIKTGMLAAETIVEALAADDYSESRLSTYKRKFEGSWVKDELWKVRNFRQGFQKGFFSGFFHAGLQMISGGRGLQDPMPATAGHTHMKTLAEHSQNAHSEPSIEFDNKLTFDKLSDVFLSDTAHEEDQPCHLRILDFDICHTRCVEDYGNPCQHFCPAAVYEMVRDEKQPRGKKLQINFTNCVHCKTCDIMDPYQIIIWTPPEGGGGPDYKNM